MGNEIIKGIAMALSAAFGDGYEIYQNDVEQGFTEPCFFIQTLKMQASALLGQRMMRRDSFDLIYYPGIAGNNAHLITIAEQMLDSLEYITLPGGDLLRAVDISYEIVDDLLHFFISFSYIQQKISVQPVMEQMDVKLGTQDTKPKESL